MIRLWCSTDEMAARWKRALTPKFCVERIKSVEAAYLKKIVAEGDILLLQLSQIAIYSPLQIYKIREHLPHAKLVVFANLPTDTQGRDFLKAGVYGYCNTYMEPELLLVVIEAVDRGQVWVGWGLMQSLIVEASSGEGLSSPAPLDISLLTKRELEICRLVSAGESNKLIAKELLITDRTVKNHLRSIFKKTGCHDRLNLAIRFQQKNHSPLLKAGF